MENSGECLRKKKLNWVQFYSKYPKQTENTNGQKPNKV